MSVRGTHNAEGKLLAVMGRTLYWINRDGVAAPVGTVPGYGRVQIDHNQISLGNEALVVNGSAGYLWNTVTNAFGRVTDPGFPGGSWVRFIDGYFVVIEPQGRFAQSSRPAQGGEWNTLDRFTSEVSPDRLTSGGVRGSELLLLSTSSGEFFQATANAQQPFRTKRISFKNAGAPGPHVAVEADNNIWWFGSDGKFYCLNGYSPQRISYRPIEDAVKSLEWSKAFAFRWDTVIYWTFPGGFTFGFDYAEREWHRRESYGMDRWRVNTMTWWDESWIAGDFQHDRLWKCDLKYADLDDGYWLEGDVPYVVRRRCGVLHDHQNRVRVPRLELVMDTGMRETVAEAFSAQPEAPVISGDSTVTGFVGDPIDGDWSATGGTPPYVFSLVPSNGLPGVIAVTSGDNGDLSGEPSADGTQEFAVRVTDSNGLWDQTPVTATVVGTTEDGWDAGKLSGEAELFEGRRALTLAGEGLAATYGNTRSNKALAGLCYLSGVLYSGGSTRLAFGIADAGLDVLSDTVRLGDTTASVAVWTDDGDAYFNGSSEGNAGSFPASTSNGVEIAVNVASRKVWIRKSGGAWVGGGDPAADTSPTATLAGTGDLYAVAGIDQSPVVLTPLYARIHPDAATTTGTVPTGFTAANWAA